MFSKLWMFLKLLEGSVRRTLHPEATRILNTGPYRAGRREGLLKGPRAGETPDMGV